MKKLTWVALLTLPWLALAQQRATADDSIPTGYPAGNEGGSCPSCAAKAGFNGYACPGTKGGPTSFKVQGCLGPWGLGVSNCLHSPPPWAGFLVRSAMRKSYNEWTGQVPGPWYLYWPDASGGNIQTGPALATQWSYEYNFTGSVMPGQPGWNAGSANAGYPSYWYGR
jgi:hypothetical protein